MTGSTDGDPARVLPIPGITERSASLRFLRASIAVVTVASYLAYVFHLPSAAFWTSGIGDWMDPYFINALLEHWYHAALTLSDPSSPPIYFPVRGTLGYSHGLVLYSLFYVPLRLVTHPFLAYNLTLLSVVATGTLCLYALLRRLGLAFVESLLLTTFFASSQNVTNGPTSVWSQRASVFLLPPILLLVLASWRMPAGRIRILTAFLGGLLGALMYTQDFYTAHFALLFLGLAAAPLLVEHRQRMAQVAVGLWAGDRRPAARAALIVAVLAAVWTAFLLAFGGVDVEVMGTRIRSNDWHRPAWVAALAAGVVVWTRAATLRGLIVARERWWVLALFLGGLAGSVIFFGFYLGVYQEHRSFPEQHLLDALASRDAALWRHPAELIRNLGAYETRRAFVAVFVATLVVWLPWSGIGWRTRAHTTWFAVVSLLVLIVPLNVGGFSLWRLLFERLPGFAVIRDPKRIIYLYELTFTLLAAAFLLSLPARSRVRWGASVLLSFLLITQWNRETFETGRPIATFERWPGRSIVIDESCRAFAAGRGSPDYTARSDHKWTLYAIDAMFIALRHDLPTLNGYSAWFPEGWDLFNPEEEEYLDRVRRWSARHRLDGVCELDIDAGVIRPF